MNEIHFYVYYVFDTQNRSLGRGNKHGEREEPKIDLLCSKEYYEKV